VIETLLQARYVHAVGIIAAILLASTTAAAWAGPGTW